MINEKFRTSQLQIVIINLLKNKEDNEYEYPQFLWEDLVKEFPYANKRSLSASLSRSLRNLQNKKILKLEIKNNITSFKKITSIKLNVNSQAVKQLTITKLKKEELKNEN